VISAFGAAAERYARGLGDLDAVVTEPDAIVHAYLEAAARRARGESFYAMVLADDPRVSLAYSAAQSIFTQFADVDLRAHAFETLAKGAVSVGDRPAAEIWNTPLQLVVAEFYRLGSAMLVRSHTEFSKFLEQSRGFARPVERVLVVPELPHFERRLPDVPTVVVWGPRRIAAHLVLHLAGLFEFVGDVWCVAGDVSGAPAGAKIGLPGDPRTAETLGRAACVVCVEPNDPGDAVAFARQGYGVVAPLTSGAHEFAPEVVIWDAANATTLHKAVVKALARPAMTLHPYAAPPRAPLAPPAPVTREELPLVSVIIPTFNRPGDLRSALSAVAAQTYPNVEAIVVNDCGSPVADVVAAFPFARLVEHAVNRGTIPAWGTGMQHAKGDWIQFLPDDDSLYPDHIERLIYAVLRSGAKIAHGNGMLRYVERQAGGGWKTTGLNASLCAETLTPTVALIATKVSENGVMHHRSVFDDDGWWRDDSSLADLELHMRLGLKFVFVHVDETTFEFREHAGNQAKLLDFGTELLRIYEQLHPRPNRPLLAEARKLTHRNMAARVPGEPAFPPTVTLA
jgi:Glycosyl transferase family 2